SVLRCLDSVFNTTSIRLDICKKQSSVDILNLLRRISINHHVEFQWIPSPLGIIVNDEADFLASTPAEERVSPTGSLTFSELSSFKKVELNQLEELLLDILGPSEEL
ncbi:hypothetical protein TNCV_293521, partial [Trichonephila clavipes]